MPSTTPNYGWSYPISSDDLNAGATTIGSLATSADSTVKTVANNLATETTNRISADNALDAAKPNCTFDNIEYAWITTTTNGSGQITLGADVSSIVIGIGRSLGAGVVALVPEASPSNKYTVYATGALGGSMSLLTSSTIQFMLSRVWS